MVRPQCAPHLDPVVRACFCYIVAVLIDVGIASLGLQMLCLFSLPSPTRCWVALTSRCPDEEAEVMSS